MGGSGNRWGRSVSRAASGSGVWRRPEGPPARGPEIAGEAAVGGPVSLPQSGGALGACGGPRAQISTVTRKKVAGIRVA